MANAGGVDEPEDTRKRWNEGLNDPNRRMYPLFAAVAILILRGWAFDQSARFGIWFLFAAALSLIQGHFSLTHFEYFW